MLKKIMTGTALAAAISVFGAAAVFAEGTDKVDSQGIRFEIPEGIRNLVTVKEDEPDAIVSVYETASMDLALTMGKDNEGAGWIFSISAVPEDKMKELRCGGMDGMEVFAEDEDIYYVFNHPTDVRLLRDSDEEMQEAMDQFSKINEWAGQEVRQEILANNPELDEEIYTNTYLDMLLAQAAYGPGIKFELRAVDYGPDPLDPASIDEDDFIEDLAEDFTYEELFDAEAPAGEYYVLAFDVDGEEVRYDFFKDPEGQNLIREVRMVGDEEYETLYQANPKEANDADETTTGIVAEWCAAIANGGEVDDD
jgi:hypothetical protein